MPESPAQSPGPAQPPARPPVTVPQVRASKVRAGAAALVMVTAYDEPSARIAEHAGVDIILVGDSVANNVLGYQRTLSVTLDDMVRHTGAVRRSGPRALVVADMPWMTYHLSLDDAVRDAAALVRAGADAVKLEGGEQRVRVIERICAASIPVMGHLGLTPQSTLEMGGYRVQAREPAEAKALLAAAQAIEDAGCFSVVLEGIPDVVASAITDTLHVPTIGIGAGPRCDGQVLVFHDLLGLGEGPVPKFVRQYAQLAQLATSALERWAGDVRSGSFPSEAETYHGSQDLRRALGTPSG